MKQFVSDKDKSASSPSKASSLKPVAPQATPASDNKLLSLFSSKEDLHDFDVKTMPLTMEIASAQPTLANQPRGAPPTTAPTRSGYSLKEYMNMINKQNV